MDTFLRILFDPGEATCYATSMYDVEATLRPVKGAELVCVNPLKGYRKDANVATFRNIVIELDKGTVEAQLAYIKHIELPHSTLTFSGGKSVHCIISLETPAADIAEYRRWVELAYTSYGQNKLDSSCKNPSRLTRLAGAMRKDKKVVQTSLYVGHRIPNDTFFAWCISRLGMKTYRSLLLPKAKKLFSQPLPNKYISRTTEALIKQGVCSESSRHASFTKAAAQLAHNGFEYEEILDLLSEPFESIISERGLSELEGIARWAVNNIKADV